MAIVITAVIALFDLKSICLQSMNQNTTSLLGQLFCNQTILFTKITDVFGLELKYTGP
jgi:hypothetical protein